MIIIIGGQKSGCGKTGLLCRLAPFFENSCVIKCTISEKYSSPRLAEDFSSETKDTAELRAAGFKAVYLLQSGRAELSDIAFEAEDICRRFRYAFIEGNSIAEHIPAHMIIYISDPSSSDFTKGSKLTEELADFRIEAFKYDAADLAEKIKTWEKNLKFNNTGEEKKMKLADNSDLDVTVNGSRIALNDYVKSVILNVVCGIVEPLKGVENAEEINIKIKKK